MAVISDLPTELILEIFQSVITTTNSSRELYSLATSNPRLYAIFKNHEYALFSYSLKRLVPTSPRMFEMIMAMGRMHCVPAASRPKTMKNIRGNLVLIIGGNPGKVKTLIRPSMYGPILAWARSAGKGQESNRSTYRNHPYDCIWHQDVLKLPKKWHCHGYKLCISYNVRQYRLCKQGRSPPSRWEHNEEWCGGSGCQSQDPLEHQKCPWYMG